MSVTVLFSFCVLAVCVSAVNPQLDPKDINFHTWVVLAAGSKGFSNYRHQADVCHAYHVLHDLGIPEDHIIVMMADDIAYCSDNPYPGKVFNDERHIDYYAGVPHDYTGDLVTADNFLSILKGEEMKVGSMKSLNSGPDDNVFVFYDDHGDFDELGFPDRVIHSEEIKDVIDTMISKKMFKNLVFYVEACFSGSLFYKLALPDNVYVTTAAPTGVSSYGGCRDDVIGDLCDFYSQAWITDLEEIHNDDYTFSDQFEVILEGLSEKSQGCAYGNNSLSKMSINEFFRPVYSATKRAETSKYKNKVFSSSIDYEYQLAKRAYERNPSRQTLKNLKREERIRDAVDRIGKAIVLAAKPDAPFLATVPCENCDSSCPCIELCMDKKSLDYCKYECCDEDSCNTDPPSGVQFFDSCVRSLATEFSNACGRGHPYLLQNSRLFVRVCKHDDVDIDNAIREIHSQCSTFNISAF